MKQPTLEEQLECVKEEITFLELVTSADALECQYLKEHYKTNFKRMKAVAKTLETLIDGCKKMVENPPMKNFSIGYSIENKEVSNENNQAVSARHGDDPNDGVVKG